MKSNRQIFKILSELTEPQLQAELLEKATLHTHQKGDIIVREGEYVKIVPIVLSGSIRVFQTRADREILLYYVEPSQTCMMSLSACFFNHSSSIMAIATEPTAILAIPTPYIAPWQKAYSSWNNFVIKTFRKRYDELLNTFESVAFDHIDRRVLSYLQQRSTKTGNRQISISHQQLANELGTTRVVISRILKQLEMDGIVGLQRGRIDLL